MVIDKESHRAALLQLLDQATFPGSAIEAVWELKQSIVHAKCFERKVDGTDVRNSGEREGQRDDS